jgi:hypothetical protein
MQPNSAAHKEYSMLLNQLQVRSQI